MARIISVFILSLICNTGFSQKISTDSIKSLLPAHFNGQLVVKKGPNTLLNFHTGFTEQVYGTPLNDSTVFNLGEISHTFIAYFIEHLATVDQLKVTDPVAKYIKNFPFPNISILNLVQHQSGLPRSYMRYYHRKKYQNMDYKMAEKAVRFDNADLLELLSKHAPKLSFTPGDSTEYSDFNYLILTSLIEKITFTPFPDFVERIFKYQHFVFSPYSQANSDTLDNRAYGYRFYPTEQTKVPFENLNSVGMPYSDGTFGNQHMYLSAKNLALWGQWLISKIDENMLKQNPNKLFFGNFKFHPEWECVSSEGAFGGTYSTLVLIPEKDLIIGLTNSVYVQNSSYKELIQYIKNADNQ